MAGKEINAAPIEQFGVGLEAHTMARLDRLRACMGVSRSKVTEAALVGGGLGALERWCGHLVEQFDSLATQAGMGWQDYAHRYARMFSRRTYPPTVADLAEWAAEGKQWENIR